METTYYNAIPKATPSLTALVNLLVARYQPLQIYQFAQLKQQEQFHSLFARHTNTEMAIYYLFVLTASNTRIEHEIQDFANVNFMEGRIMIFAHGKETLDRCLAQSNYFFTLVLKQGTLLYSNNGLMQREEVDMPKPQQRLEQARLHWKHRNKMAQGFLLAAERALDEGHDLVMVFLLHQVIEQCCIGLIWVFMGYKSDIHNLKRLLYICGCFSELPYQHFFCNGINVAQLELIMRSYGQARYQKDFELDGTSPSRLFDLTAGFMQLASQLCEKKFKELEVNSSRKVER